MNFANKLVTKGWLGSVISKITSGWISSDDDIVVELNPPCDFPHAVNLATRGRLGAQVGTATRGAILRVCPDVIEIIPPTFGGPAKRGFRDEEEKKKVIYICVEAYGKKFVHEEVASVDCTIEAKDINILEVGNKEITIEVKFNN